uniref:Protein SSUH2 homolog n=1 Tax=Hadrurus spadix TaxID=141984 RepID=A0A1W7R9I4_9SCOR
MDLLSFFYPIYKILLPKDYSLLQSRRSTWNYSINTRGQLPNDCRSYVADIRQPELPCLTEIDKPPGYEDITFEPRILVPPACSESEPPPVGQNIQGFAVITEEDVRDSLLRDARGHCCYTKNTARGIKIREIAMCSTFQYTLETFTEKREIVWCYDPYYGEAFDSVKSGTAPGPWNIGLTPTEQFKDGAWQTEIPNTATVITCCVCEGGGKEKCISCEGSIQVDCTWCNGRGRRLDGNLCNHCNSEGKKKCTECCCTGQMQCGTCIGEGKLKCYIKLITTWTNHKDDFVHQEAPLPLELIRNIPGQVAFQEQKSRVWTIDNFPQRNVNQVSNDFVSKHSTAFPSERILQQRQEVRIVPIARVKYTWKDNFGEFFVYGFGNKIYFPEYPQSWFCGCVIV